MLPRAYRTAPQYSSGYRSGFWRFIGDIAEYLCKSLRGHLREAILLTMMRRDLSHDDVAFILAEICLGLPEVIYCGHLICVCLSNRQYSFIRNLIAAGHGRPKPCQATGTLRSDTPNGSAKEGLMPC